MASGDTLSGKRRPDYTLPHELEPGEYSLTEGGRAVWLCSPRGEAGRVEAPIWNIVVEDDDTLTIDPSIFWDRDKDPPGWHGYVTKGNWFEV